MTKFKDIELLDGDMIINAEIYNTNYTVEKKTMVWDSKNKGAVELETYLKRILPIKRKIKVQKLKNKLEGM